MNCKGFASIRGLAGLAVSAVAIATIVVPSIAYACDPGSLFPCDDGDLNGVKNCNNSAICPSTTVSCTGGNLAWCCGAPRTCQCHGAANPPSGCIAP